MTDQPNESIIRKIQLLLNLGKRSAGNEVEAEAAMAKAQELLAKYNLDLAVVEDAKVAGGTAVVAEKREKTRMAGRSAMYQWQQALCRAIAEANFCWYWTQVCDEDRWGRTVRAKRHVILGREENVAAVRIMYEWLADTIEELAGDAYESNMCRSAVSWKVGFAERVAERLQRKAWEMSHPKKVDGETPKMGLVLASLATREYASNYDALYGEGSHAKAAEATAKYRLERAAAPKVETKPKTKAEEEKADRDYKRWQEKCEREQQRKAERTDSAAYNAGREVGDKMNLSDRLN